MRNVRSTPRTGAYFDGLSGSALAVTKAIHVVWPKRPHRRKQTFNQRPRDVLKEDGGHLIRGQPLAPLDGGSTLGIGLGSWKAIFRATWPSKTENSTPLAVFSERPWINYSLTPDTLLATPSKTA